MVYRIFVEKKKGFDVEAQGLFEDIKQSLSVEGLKGLRVLNRYDIEGIDRETFELSKTQVFSEPPIDEIYDEFPTLTNEERTFAIEYLPGQYDQRADSAAVCINLLNPEVNPRVRFARVIILQGKISDKEFYSIENYVMNPVDSRLASMEVAESLDITLERPDMVEVVEGFIIMNENELHRFKEEWALAMSMDDFKMIQDYFKNENRNPTVTEIKVIDTYWSDHCRHTTFNTEISNIEFEDSEYGNMVKEAFEEYLNMRKSIYKNREKPVTLMDMACIGTKYLKSLGKASLLDESEEINACSIKIKAMVNGKEEDWIVMFKNETHNHPTEIEPFGGAATCLGGAIRDPLSGRAYVYQAMRLTGSGDPRTSLEDTLRGKLPQRKITREAAAGYSSYGNQIGIATGQVEEVYHPNYVAKRMEVGAVIGAAPSENIVRQNPAPGDVIILLGGKTGRDGCGGATGSSKEHNLESIENCGAEVQKGNPPVERNIQRLFRRKEASTLIKRCNDFGAGGVSVAIGELAPGLEIDLDKVPRKYEGLDGTELAISESQERMAVVIEQKDLETFVKLADEENLSTAVVAKVTEESRVKMYWQGQCILDLKREFLDTNGATQVTDVEIVHENENICWENFEHDYQYMNQLPELLKDINVAMKRGLINRFDSTIGAGTLLMPLGGKYQLTPALGMAAKLPVLDGDTTTGTLMSYGYDPFIASHSPFKGAYYAVVDSVAKLIAMGGRLENVYLSFQEYFEKLTDSKSWGRPAAALLGALEVQRSFQIPAIGGKDSMSGTFMDIKVPPALISFAVTTVEVENVMTNVLQKEGSKLVFIRAPRGSNGLLDLEGTYRLFQKIETLISEGGIVSIGTVTQGGVFASLIKMALGNKIGFSVAGLSSQEWQRKEYGSFIVELHEDADLQELLGDLDYEPLGRTNGSDRLEFADEKCENGISITLDEALADLEEGLDEIFPKDVKDEKNTPKVEKINYKKRSDIEPEIKNNRPRVVIPTFPGTNCEVDSKRAFDKAGAESNIVIIRNKTKRELEESIRELADSIKNSDIIFIPGGFSGGDEPDGSAKFITAVFRNPLIRKEVEDLIDRRKGLVIGICNGFQALIKLGLVPFGKYVDPSEENPTLTYNRIGRHMSGFVRTRIASVLSPWFKNIQLDDVYNIPISHGEGRFICKEELLKELIENGQVATQYVDIEGNPSMSIEDNPNYSIMAIEAITSPDGRILGKMGHSERIGEGLYKNIYGDMDMKLFQSAVDYFKDR